MIKSAIILIAAVFIATYISVCRLHLFISLFQLFVCVHCVLCLHLIDLCQQLQRKKIKKNEAIDTKKFDTEKIEKIYTYIFLEK